MNASLDTVIVRISQMLKHIAHYAVLVNGKPRTQTDTIEAEGRPVLTVEAGKDGVALSYQNQYGIQTIFLHRYPLEEKNKTMIAQFLLRWIGENNQSMEQS